MSKNFFPLRALLISIASVTLVACASAPEPVTPQTVTKVQVIDVEESIVLESDALFKFDRGDIEGLTARGFVELGELVETLKNDFESIESIELVGHTDRLGSDAYNLTLSQQRAETVKQYLQERGILTPIAARGVGKAQPVTTDCQGEVATPELIACLQPNRRVVVNVNGTRLVAEEVEIEVEVKD